MSESQGKSSNSMNNEIALVALLAVLGYLLFPFLFLLYPVFVGFDSGRRRTREGQVVSFLISLFCVFIFTRLLMNRDVGFNLSIFGGLGPLTEFIQGVWLHSLKSLKPLFGIKKEVIYFKSWFWKYCFAVTFISYYAGKKYQEDQEDIRFGFIYHLVSIINTPANLVSVFVYAIEYIRYKRTGSTQKSVKSTEDVFAFGTGNGYLTADNLALHSEVIGGTGTGKTNFLKNYAYHNIALGKGIIFLDYKADEDLKSWFGGIAERGERSLGTKSRFRVIDFSNAEQSEAYNPFKTGSASEISDQIMGSLNWSEEYYRGAADNYVELTSAAFCHIRDTRGLEFTFDEYRKFVEDSEFRDFVVANCVDFRLISEVKNLKDDMAKPEKVKELAGLMNQLNKIIRSEAGRIMVDKAIKYESFDFERAIQENQIVYICVNSMALKESSKAISKILLKDLMKSVSHLYGRHNGPSMPIVIDEFASFATEDFMSFLDKARGAGVELMIAHQSMSDLSEISESFKNRIYENTANKVIFTVQNPNDATYFADNIGTSLTYEYTDRVEQGLFTRDKHATGTGSRRAVHEYVIHPNEFKRLQFGQCVVISSKRDPHVGVVNINKANDFSAELPYESSDVESGNISMLEASAEAYRRERADQKKKAQQRERIQADREDYFELD